MQLKTGMTTHKKRISRGERMPVESTQSSIGICLF